MPRGGNGGGEVSRSLFVETMRGRRGGSGGGTCGIIGTSGAGPPAMADIAPGVGGVAKTGVDGGMLRPPPIITCANTEWSDCEPEDSGGGVRGVLGEFGIESEPGGGGDIWLKVLFGVTSEDENDPPANAFANGVLARDSVAVILFGGLMPGDLSVISGNLRGNLFGAAAFRGSSSSDLLYR